MVAEARTWVDVEGALREWARDSVPAVSRRVFFGVNNSADMPQIALFRIAGPDDRALIQFDCWSSRAQGKGVAQAVSAELASAADLLTRYTHAGVLLHGALVTGVRWQPDEESDDPRYIVELLVTASADN
jgi:hypothetical protein